jgi:hypothetical protein
MAENMIEPQTGTPKSNEYRKQLVDQAIENLKQKLIKEAKPLPPEFSRTVNKHFWELMSTTSA